MGVRQEQAREPLGSLSSVGEVYVDDSPAAAESTIFVGDKVQTGGNRLCGIYHEWKGRTEDFAQSQVTFTRDYQFTAELTHGEGSNRSARPRLKDKVSAARFGQKEL